MMEYQVVATAWLTPISTESALIPYVHPVIWPEELHLRGGEKLFFEAIRPSLKEDDILICGLAFNNGGKDIEIDFLLLRKDYGFIIFEKI